MQKRRPEESVRRVLMYVPSAWDFIVSKNAKSDKRQLLARQMVPVPNLTCQRLRDKQMMHVPRRSFPPSMKV